MGSLSKSFALILILSITISGLTLTLVKTVSAQSIPTPTVPTFTVTFVTASETSTTTNPYTGVTTTTQGSNDTIQIKIKNPSSAYPNNYYVYYDYRIKPHFEGNWSDEYPPVTFYSGANYSQAEYIVFNPPETNSAYTVLSLSSINYSPLSEIPGWEIDFEVAELVGVNSTYYVPLYPGGIPVIPKSGVALVARSDWSSTQTVTIPTSSPSPTQTPTTTSTPTSTTAKSASNSLLLLTTTVALIVIAFLLAVIIALLLYMRKQGRLTGVNLKEDVNISYG